VTANRTSLALTPLVRMVRARAAAEQSDGHLLEHFIAQRDEAAFATLVRRHGPMVLGVCRRVLGNAADAEDAFQAVFLVLLRKAVSLTSRSVLGDWLHGVARRTAMKALAKAVRRRAKERALARPEVLAPAVRNDRLSLLDDELCRLPPKYRMPIVLCDLEGKTRREAAEHLGWPEGTVAGRLVRGRALLAKRLLQSVQMLSAVLLAPQAAPATQVALPSKLVHLTVQAGLAIAGKATVRVVPSVEALTLAQGVIQTMLWNKIKLGGLALVVTIVTAAIGGLSFHLLAGEGQSQPTKDQTEIAGFQGQPKEDASGPKKPKDQADPGRPEQGIAPHLRGPNQTSEEAARWLKANLSRFQLNLDGYGWGWANLRFVTDKKVVEAGPAGRVFWISPAEAASFVQTLVDTGLWNRSDTLPPGPLFGRYLVVGPSPGGSGTWRLGELTDDVTSMFVIQSLLRMFKGEREKAVRDWLALPKKKGNNNEAPPKEGEPKKVQPADQAIGDPDAPKLPGPLRAELTVNPHVIEAGVDNPLLQITFSLHNDSAKVINPKVRYSKIIVDGKVLPDSARIFSSGPRSDKFDALQPGDELRFGYAMGKYFNKAGIYRVSWEGDGYVSPAVLIWVQPSKRQ
jgi:RNA polymerase sigma factor (sigma-70 family)